MTIQQLIERLISIYVVNPTAEIVICNTEYFEPDTVDEVFYHRSKGKFVINGGDES